MSDGPARSLRELIARGNALFLGTVDELGHPHVSYVPCAPENGRLVFAISRLAAHTRHLEVEETIAATIVGDETGDAYARPRLTLLGRAQSRPAGSTGAERAWDALQARHGSTVSVLRTLADFTTYEIEAERGRLVLGFASAHDVTQGELRAAFRDM